MSATPKSIIGTPLANSDMVAPWGIGYVPRGYLESEHVNLAIPAFLDEGGIRVTRNELTLESFYELREAVNDLYDHIREEQSTD